jgi:hypothetical protein
MYPSRIAIIASLGNILSNFVMNESGKQVDRECMIAAVQNMLKISSLEEIDEICALLGIDSTDARVPQSQDVVASTEDERRKADMDQYADAPIAGDSTPRASTSPSDSVYIEMAKFVPLRLEYDERRYLRLLESVVDSAEYTDRVDSIPVSQQTSHRSIALVLKNICSLLSGLVIAHDASDSTVKSVLTNRDFTKFKTFYRKVFEIGRRYKILNPERMRESYFKMMYFLQDLNKPEVSELFDFCCVEPVQTVYSLLESKPSASFALLSDPLLETATTEISSKGKTKYKVQDEIRAKESAIKRLTAKYSPGRSLRPQRSRFNMSSFFSSRAGDDSSADEDATPTLSRDEIERCVYSICDYQSFLRFNQQPCERMIELLEKYFGTPSSDPSASLSIAEGDAGARLTHSHSRQYTFVLQSLTLWAEVMKDMFRLWHAAEADLLDPKNPYVRTQTGQGLQRIQKAPRVYAIMVEILARVQKRLGGWVGSSTIHLGDENVPNALIFIDKYMQVPKILGPVVLVVEKIETESGYRTGTPGLAEVVDALGGAEQLQREILRDFFRHGFDGSGGDTFFEAGSCVDGRLTSAWNWCSQIETKPYYPVFQLTGFTGFDSR